MCFEQSDSYFPFSVAAWTGGAGAVKVQQENKRRKQERDRGEQYLLTRAVKLGKIILSKQSVVLVGVADGAATIAGPSTLAWAR